MPMKKKKTQLDEICREKESDEQYKEQQQILETEKEWLFVQQLPIDIDNDDDVEVLWKCFLCGRENSKSVSYCQSCSLIQHQNIVLKLQGVLNDKEWEPCEEQEYGWVLQNQSNFPLKIKAKLERVGTDRKEIEICEEGIEMIYEVKAHEEIYVVVNTRAPPLCGKYTTAWRMTVDNRNIGPLLEMKMVVKSHLSREYEQKVEQMISEFGFDRDLAVAALSANSWNFTSAVEALFDSTGEK